MALTSLIYRREPGKIGELELDVTVAENHTFNSLVTKFSIESGGKVSDHIINEPVRLTMTGFITNSPIKLIGRGETLREFGLKVISNNVQNAFILLTDLREIKEPFTVVTGLKVYRSMVFENINIPRDRTTGETLRFTAVLTRISKAKTKKIELQNLAQDETGVKENVKNLSAEEVDKGAQVTTEATEEETQRVSILKGIVKGVTGQ